MRNDWIEIDRGLDVSGLIHRMNNSFSPIILSCDHLYPLCGLFHCKANVGWPTWTLTLTDMVDSSEESEPESGELSNLLSLALSLHRREQEDIVIVS